MKYQSYPIYLPNGIFGGFFYRYIPEETAVEKLFKRSQEEKIPETERMPVLQECDCYQKKFQDGLHADWCSTKR